MRTIDEIMEMVQTGQKPEYDELRLPIYAIEAGAWSKGFEIAAKYGVVFSESAIQHAHSKLATYIKSRR
jgi:hypothetical protein